MKKILIKISRVLQVVLMAPIKLPGKAMNILKYIALGLGVVETVLEDKDEKENDEPPVNHDKQQLLDIQSEASVAKPAVVLKKEKEVPDENK